VYNLLFFFIVKILTFIVSCSISVKDVHHILADCLAQVAHVAVGSEGEVQIVAALAGPLSV
jgi:hypothetical protein